MKNTNVNETVSATESITADFKTKISPLLWIIFILFFTMTACEDDGEGDVSPNETANLSNQEEARSVRKMITEVDSIVDESTDLSGFGFRRDCPNRTIESPEEGGYPKVITIDFGESCGIDTISVKSGKIVITITGDMREIGSEIIYAYQDFYMDGYKIEGTTTTTNVSETMQTSILAGGKITTPDGEIISYESTSTSEMTAGNDTRSWRDDVYQITGSTNINFSNGGSFTETITEPLVNTGDCWWTVSGIVETVDNGVSSTLNYGDGTCDNVAELTTEDGVEEVTLGFKRR
ncbi:MAG: hypothetical protein AAGI07_14555 [Bacteroidota bacterium]